MPLILALKTKKKMRFSPPSEMKRIFFSCFLLLLASNASIACLHKRVDAVCDEAEGNNREQHGAEGLMEQGLQGRVQSLCAVGIVMERGHDQEDANDQKIHS